jgi:hypothetical protein
MRSANRKALKPQPTHQAKLVAWHLTTRVPLNVVAIPEAEIVSACERFNLPLETWRSQERAFGLLQKVYAKRAAIRGQQCQTPAAPNLAGPQSLGDQQNLIGQPQQRQPQQQSNWAADALRQHDAHRGGSSWNEPADDNDGVPRAGW